jgi:hypothetical protein
MDGSIAGLLSPKMWLVITMLGPFTELDRIAQDRGEGLRPELRTFFERLDAIETAGNVVAIDERRRPAAHAAKTEAEGSPRRPGKLLAFRRRQS